MVCDNFAESSSHHLQTQRIPYISFSHVHVHTQTNTNTRPALGNQKQTVLNCKPCRLLESPCHLFASQMFIISSQVCGCKTKGTLGKNKFPCQNSIANLAGVTFCQISALLMFLSMPQFSQIVEIYPSLS